MVVDGKEYATNEHFYQACKANNEEDHEKIRNANSPGIVKKLGRAISIRSDWEKVKEEVMYKGLSAKFRQNEELKQKLLETGDAYLEETNHWKDRYWGVCEGTGLNKLGEALMLLRGEFLLEKLIYD